MCLVCAVQVRGSRRWRGVRWGLGARKPTSTVYRRVCYAVAQLRHRRRENLPIAAKARVNDMRFGVTWDKLMPLKSITVTHCSMSHPVSRLFRHTSAARRSCSQQWCRTTASRDVTFRSALASNFPSWRSTNGTQSCENPATHTGANRRAAVVSHRRTSSSVCALQLVIPFELRQLI